MERTVGLESTLIVLRDSVRPKDLEAVALANQWQLTEDRQRARLDEPFQRAYQTSAGVELRYVEDHLINVKTLRVSGENCSGELGILRQSLGNLTREDALGACNVTQGDLLIGALYKLSQFGSELVDKEILDVYEKASVHEALGVRRACITAMAYTPWPECIKILEDLARRDSRLRMKSMQLVEAIDPSRKAPSEGKGGGKGKQKNRKRR